MTYHYGMIQMNKDFSTRALRDERQIANYFEETARLMARDGWEFFRMDPIRAIRSSGCLGLFGQQRTETHYIMTFRHPVEA